MPFVSLGAAAATPAPTHAGARTKEYDTERCVYNWKSSNTRRLKAALGLGGYFGTSKGSLLVYGDSASEAQVGTSSWQHAFSWPAILQHCLVAGGNFITPGAGGVMPGGHNIFFGSSGINGFDGRASRTGTWTNSPNGYITGANGATLTFPVVAGGIALVQVSGTAVDVAYEFVSGSGFTVAIDGGAAVQVPMTGSGYKHYTVTGLTDTTHSVVITVNTATAPRIMGLSVYRTHGFMVHNLSRSGSTAEEWGAGAAGGLREHRAAAITPGSTPGAAIIKLGANDLVAGRTAAQVKSYLTNLKTALSGLDVILMTYAETGTPGAEWLPLLDMYYDLADEWDCPLIDVTARTGGFAAANAAGIMAADGNHPNTRYHAALGAQVASLLIA